PVLDAGRHLHGELLLAFDATGAAAARAPLLHDLAGAAARVARSADAEEALLEHQLAAAAAARARLGPCTRLRARAAARRARAHLRDLERRLADLEQLLQLHLER